MKNALLWKRILHEGLGNANLPTEVKNNLERDVIGSIIIANPMIADFEEGEDWGWEKYKHIAVPFDRCWVESASSSSLFGCLMDCVKMHGTEQSTALFMHCFYCRKDHPVTFQGSTIIRADANGDIDSLMLRQGVGVTVPVAAQKAIDAGMISKEQIVCAVLTIVATTLDVLLFLGCKNTSLLQKEMGLSNKEVRHADRKSGKRGCYRYHVLVVRPPGAKSDSPGVEIGTMPRHVCRGHFAEYGAEFGKGLLFGKYSGRFYIPPCVKGDPKNGIVEKDYEVRHGT